MKLTVDRERYDEYQEAVLQTMILYIKSTLQRHPEISDQHINALTEEIAFDVFAVIDGSAVMGTKDKPVLPFLAFSESDEERGHLIVNEYGTHLHERVMGYFDES